MTRRKAAPTSATVKIMWNVVTSRAAWLVGTMSPKPTVDMTVTAKYVASIFVPSPRNESGLADAIA